jgi:hypothetical protein
MTEYRDFARAARESVLVGVSFDAVVVGAAVALAAVLAGGEPLVLAALGEAFAGAQGRAAAPVRTAAVSGRLRRVRTAC